MKQHLNNISFGAEVRMTLVAAVLLSCFGFDARHALAQSTLYKAGKVITMNGETLSPGMVLVSEGKISAVAESLDAGEGVEVVDFGEDAVIMPGLINAYSQAGLAAETSDEFSREVTPDFESLHSINWNALGMKKLSDSGTTTVCICPGRENVIAGLSTVVKTIDGGDDTVVSEKGPLVTNLCSDPANRNEARRRPDSIYVRQPTNRMGVVWLLRSHFDRASREDETPTGLETIRDALNGKMTTYMFSRKSHDISTTQTLAAEFNFRPVLVGGQESNLVVDLLKKNKVSVVLTPIPTGLMQGEEGIDICLNRAGILADAGVTICLSGDDLLEQARFAVRFGLDRQTALTAITTTPAKILGIEQQVGAIMPKLDADLLVLNGDPLQLTTAIQGVIIGGKQIYGSDAEVAIEGDTSSEDTSEEVSEVKN